MVKCHEKASLKHLKHLKHTTNKRNNLDTVNDSTILISLSLTLSRLVFCFLFWFVAFPERATHVKLTSIARLLFVTLSFDLR